MAPVTFVAVASTVFLVTHIGLTLAPIRTPLRARLGEAGFVGAYTLVAAVAFSFMVHSYAVTRDEGPLGPALAAIPSVRVVLIVVSLTGVALMVGAFAPKGYWESPSMILVGRPREPYGLERITRHPFMAGLVLWAIAHASMSSRLTGVIFFAVLIVTAVLGSAHQAGKLRRRHGEGYDRFLRTTSAVPFVAILRGRQRFSAAETPWVWLALGVASGVGLHALHPSLLAHGGVWVIAAVLGVVAVIGIVGMRRRA